MPAPADFRSYVQHVLASPAPPIPERLTVIGAVTAEWIPLVDAPATAVVITAGGSAVDRHVVGRYVAEQLAHHGYRLATVDLESEGMRRTAAWSDIMAKAKRLIQSGQVTVGVNSWANVVGHVIGDHGEYNSEFSRDDPNSGVITQWSCECPWAQYSWGRTRQWKKYEGRVCAHVLALYWKAKSTPLDGDHPSGQTPRGQMGPPPPNGQMGLPGADVAPQAPDAPAAAPSAPPAAPAPSQGEQGQLFDPAAIPPPPMGVIPSFPGEQMSLFENYAGPGTTPGGGQSPPWAVSVPGAAQPSPTNPIQNMNTLSRVAATLEPGQRVILQEDEYGTREGREGSPDAGQWTLIPRGTPGQVFDVDETTGLVCVLFELHGGPMSSYHVRCYVDSKQVKPGRGRSPLDPGQVPKKPLL